MSDNYNKELKFSDYPVPIIYKSKGIYGTIKRNVYFKKGLGMYIKYNNQKLSVSYARNIPKAMQIAKVLDEYPDRYILSRRRRK